MPKKTTFDLLNSLHVHFTRLIIKEATVCFYDSATYPGQIQKVFTAFRNMPVLL